MIDIVLDANCLISSFSKRGNYFNVWRGLHSDKYILYVSNEILEEYEEIISMKTNALIASNVIQALLNSPYMSLIDPHYHFHLIHADKDDNKFVDCAIAAGADYLVSNDAHFKVLSTVSFPKLSVIDLASFSDLLEGRKLYNTSSSVDLMVNEEMVEYSSDNNGM